MRGKRQEEHSRVAHKGITPADAGKTPRRDTHKNQARDHPRGCGENVCPKAYSPCQRGSPPRMRGKPARTSRKSTKDRITPADAGKTDAPAQVALENEDHPRGCGENPQTSPLRAVQGGSPPRMRGKRGHSDCTAPSRGITPADAGKTQ